jgi:predicted Zn-dependent peptidase
MANGLHVYVIENHEQPTLSIGISIRGGDAYDPAGKEGTAAIMGDMLGKGTKSRTAQAMAEALDGVGAGISVTTAGESMGVSASMLKKHMNVVFPILRDQLQEPTFDEQELAKLKKQYIASIASRRSRPNEIAQALSRKVIYGMNNPLARRQLEKTVNAVTREDVVAFHNAYIRPNLASIAFVGDITEKEARDIVNKYFSDWKKGTAPTVEIPPMRTEPAGVYFVPRKGSVQSTVIVSAAGPAVRESDYDATDIMTSYIGGGFGSVLFNTLRETYSYTYSPFSVLTRGRRYNRIAFGAEVRNSVTDSAITVMMRELAKLANEGPDEEALARRVVTEVGQYQLAFEQAGTVGSVLQNAWLNDVPIEDVTTYTDRLARINAGDVQQAAAKYLNMFNLRLIVVGSPDVKSKIEQFGPIKEFTLDLEPMQESAYENVGMTPQQLIEKHVEALGGRAAVDAVKTMTMKADVSMTLQGNDLSGTYERIVATPNKEFSSINLGVMTQQQWANGYLRVLL